MLQEAILRLDVHGMTKYQAKLTIDSQLKKAGSGVYRLRVIHGYRGGTELKKMIRREYACHPKVLRLDSSLNPGETDLVLREL